MSSIDEAGALERLRDRVASGPCPVSCGRQPGRRPRPHDRERLEAVLLRVVAVDDHHRGRAVVQARRVAGGDAEALDLGVQRLERRELLHRGAAARVLVDRERHRSCRRAAAPRSGRSRLRSGPRRSRATARDVRLARPVVHLLAGDADLLRGVPADRDRHVERGRVGRLGVARRHPRLHLVGAQHPLHRARRRRDRLRATGDDDACPCRP